MSSGDKDEMRRHLNNAYIETKLNSIIEPMVKQLMSEQPANHVSNNTHLNDFTHSPANQSLLINKAFLTQMIFRLTSCLTI
jgi:hypothetical protein